MIQKKPKKQKTPQYRIIEIRRDRWKPLRTASGWLFRFLIVGLAIGILVYNQHALSSAVKTVEELKRSLLLNETEWPIKKVLDRQTQGKLNELERIKITKLIAVREAEGVDPRFTLDLIRRESGFNPQAVSHKGAIGLMQLLPSTARWLAQREGHPSLYAEEMLFDPVTNVKLGMAYLGHLSQSFRGEYQLRAAYQMGPGRLREIMKKGGNYASNP